MGKTYRNTPTESRKAKTRSTRRNKRQEAYIANTAVKYGNPSWGLKEDWDDLIPTNWK